MDINDSCLQELFEDNLSDDAKFICCGCEYPIPEPKSEGYACSVCGWVTFPDSQEAPLHRNLEMKVGR